MASSPRAVAPHPPCPLAGGLRAYQPRAAEQGVLYTIIRDHLETFLREAAQRAEGAGLPDFVEQEFRDFLTCGILAHGFARVRCDACAFERLVPFSCKGRGFCPSCGGRRMTEPAAHLAESETGLLRFRPAAQRRGGRPAARHDPYPRAAAARTSRPGASRRGPGAT